jgi:hypothetical protein
MFVLCFSPILVLTISVTSVIFAPVSLNSAIDHILRLRFRGFTHSVQYVSASDRLYSGLLSSLVFLPLKNHLTRRSTSGLLQRTGNILIIGSVDATDLTEIGSMIESDGYPDPIRWQKERLGGTA